MAIVGTLAAAGHAGAFGKVVEYVRDGDIAEVDALDIGSIGLQQTLEGESVTFLVYGCTRGFTHEFVRTRKGAWFLQQTMRHTDMGNANVRMPEYIANANQVYQSQWAIAIGNSIGVYQELVNADTPYEDARSVLPIATETWIIGGMPLRTWLETYEYRACHMFYPEMRYIFGRMKDALAKRAPNVARQAHITCERKGICTYRGAEDTTGCPIYPGAREWQSPLYDDRTLLALYGAKV
jgi:thymidylate synthase ThyX